MADDVQLIKDKIDLVDFVGEYVKLKKVGRNFNGLCPFHTEKTPSFFVSPERQRWHCFGCNRGGDLYSFLMEKEGLDFGEALRILAKRAGVTLTHKASPKQSYQKDRLLEIQHRAAEFYRYLLTQHKVGQKARDYLKSRGVTNELIKNFKLGYAPLSWRSTTRYLLSKGYQPSELVQAGLTILSPDEKTYYDRFRGRIMFPVFDNLKRLVGFSGRTLTAEEQAKYINSPETPIFFKHKLLYGMQLAKDEIRRSQEAILVEGNLDAIACHKIGLKNTVAPLGTALNLEQLNFLKRFVDEIIFAFDNDAAGQKATQAGLLLGFGLGLTLKVCEISNAKDPDEAIQKDPEVFKKDLSSAQPAFDFLIKFSHTKFDLKAPTGKKQAAYFVLPFLVNIPDAILKDSFIKTLAAKLDVEEQSVWEDLERLSQTPSHAEKAEQEGGEIQSMQPVKTRQENLEELFLALILQAPVDFEQDTKLQKILKDTNSSYFIQEKFRFFWEHLANELQQKQSLETIVNSQPQKADLKEVLDLLMLMDVAKIVSEEKLFRQTLISTYKELKRTYLKRQLKLLVNEMKRAEQASAEEAITSLSNQIKQLTVELKGLDD